MPNIEITHKDCYSLDRDIQLIKKLNGIMMLLKNYECVKDTVFIKAELVMAYNVVLAAFENDMKCYFYRLPQNKTAHSEAEVVIRQFEEFINGETSGIKEAYQHLYLS